MRKELAALREQKGYTQEFIAHAVGVSRSYYGHIENGNRNPSYGLAKKIAKVLGAEPEDIFLDLDGFRMKQQNPHDDQAATTEPGPKPAA